MKQQKSDPSKNYQLKQEGIYRHVSINQNEDLSMLETSSPMPVKEEDDLAAKLEKYRKENIILLELIDKEDRKIKMKEP